MEKVSNIDVEEAVYFLMSAERELTNDKVRWVREGRSVAQFTKEGLKVSIDSRTQIFTGEDADRLSNLGIASTDFTQKN